MLHLEYLSETSLADIWKSLIVMKVKGGLLDSDV